MTRRHEKGKREDAVAEYFLPNHEARRHDDAMNRDDAMGWRLAMRSVASVCKAAVFVQRSLSVAQSQKKIRERSRSNDVRK